jgi:nicotinate-nucleotide adenylyltransferase
LKLGIFGGTFNPIHYGHLINAEIIRSDYGLDKIIFIPSKSPVHKDLAGGVSAKDRCTMVSLGIRDVKGFEVSTIEIDREGPSYTIATIRELETMRPRDHMFLIIGTDSLREIDTWKDPEQLLQSVPVIAMKRPGAKALPGMDLTGYRIQYANNPLIDISSTCIRERVKDKKSVRFLLPDSVIRYIKKGGLYRH